MKKLILNFATVLFVLSCFFLTSCEIEPELEQPPKVEKTFSFENLNAADVDLKINSIVVYSSSNYYSSKAWWQIDGHIQNTVQINKEIQKKSVTQTLASLKIEETIEYNADETPPDYIKINCSYLTSNGTTAHHYVGTLNGEDVSIKVKTHTLKKNTEQQTFVLPTKKVLP